MALFTNRIAPARVKLGRVHQLGVVCRIAVTPCALYARNDLLVPVQSCRLQLRTRAVAEQAVGRDRTREVGLGVMLVSRRVIPGVAICIVAHGSLVEVTLILKGKTAAHSPRADEKG